VLLKKYKQFPINFSREKRSQLYVFSVAVDPNVPKMGT